MAGGATVAHEYDVDGNRVQTNVTPSGESAVTTNTLVDTAGGLSEVVADTDGSGNLTALYVRNGDQLVAVMRPAAGNTWSTRFVHGDGLGSVRVLSDETGTTVDSRAYEAFGTKDVEAGNDMLTYGFAGEPFESTSMLAYQRARWMDARVGRFLGLDPKDGDTRHPASQHRYIYGMNEPTSIVDPTGEDGVDSLPNYTAMVLGLPAFPGSGVAVPVLGGKVLIAGCAPGQSCASVDLNSEVPRALTYLGLSSHGNALLFYVLGAAPITLYQSDGVNSSSLSAQNIFWNPHHALVEIHTDPNTGLRGRLSPAVQLAHELAHIVLKDPSDYPSQSSPVPGPVLTLEDQIAQDLSEFGFGESPRQEVNIPLLGIRNPYFDSAYGGNSPGPCRVSHSDTTSCPGVP